VARTRSQRLLQTSVLLFDLGFEIARVLLDAVGQIRVGRAEDPRSEGPRSSPR
jgi:hypothetical protein